MNYFNNLKIGRRLALGFFIYLLGLGQIVLVVLMRRVG